MARPLRRPFKETNREEELVKGLSRRRYFSRTSLISGGKGKRRCWLPLPSTHSCASARRRSSSRRARTSQERRPSSNIRPTRARSRKVRKLFQNWARQQRSCEKLL